jgi:hypothetical protein
MIYEMSIFIIFLMYEYMHIVTLFLLLVLIKLIVRACVGDGVLDGVSWY